MCTFTAEIPQPICTDHCPGILQDGMKIFLAHRMENSIRGKFIFQQNITGKLIGDSAKLCGYLVQHPPAVFRMVP